MPRPIKYGLDFFNLDVDFYQDIKVRKLVRSQGGKAIAVYVLLLGFTYKNGYYMRWDPELPFIISEITGFEEVYIQEAIKYCLSVGLFSKELFEKEGVLTSKEIQENYREVSARRAYSIKDYSLISASKMGVIATETPVIATETPVIATETPVIATETPVIAAISTQSKVKESKEKEKLSNESTKKAPEGLSSPSPRKSVQKRFQKPTAEEIDAYCKERGNGIDARKFYDFYESKGWVVGKSPMKDWKAAVRTWEQRDDFRMARQPSRLQKPTQADIYAENERMLQETLKKIEEKYGAE